jgi:hypothetical protein
MSVNYYNRYLSLFEFEKRTQSNYVKMNPKNFYRISKYEYSDGDVKSLVGRDSSLIFVVGVYEDKINCIKLNEVLPEIFIEWVSTILKPDIINEDIDNMKIFSEVVIPSDRSGNVLFNSKIKTNRIYKQKPTPYRTYNLDGLKYIQKINLKKEIIKSLL